MTCNLKDDGALDIEPNDCDESGAVAERANGTVAYGIAVLSKFAEQREKEGYCDLIIDVENQRFPVHRCLMAATCDFFEALNRSGMEDSRKNQLTLRGVSLAGFKILLDFIYTGHLNISIFNMDEVLQTVTHLQNSHALEICKSYMIYSLSCNNCVKILGLAELYSIEAVVEKAMRFIEKNFSLLLEDHSFLTLPFERMLSLVKSDHLRLSPELRVFEAVRAWIEYAPGDRIRYASSLMEHVRLLTIPSEHFVDVVSKCGFMRTDPQCSELLIESLEYFAVPHRQYSCNNPRGQIRNRPVMVCVNENMYIFNNDLHQWQFYGSSLSSWKTLSQKFIVVNNYLYACGGYSERNRETTGGCHRFNPQTGVWTTIAPMIEKRQFFTLTANGKLIAAVGGVYGDRGNFYASHPVHCPLEIYHIDQNTWKCVRCEMPVLKWPGACVFDHFVFIVGGKHTDGHDHRLSQQSYLVNIKTGSVEQRKSPITPRFNSSMFYVDNKAILFGGEDDKYRLAPCVEVYNFETDEWSEIAQIPVNLSYQYISTSYIRDKRIFYLMEEHDGPTSESYVLKCASFDLESGTFSESTTLPHPQAILASRWCSLVFPQEFFRKTAFPPASAADTLPGSITTSGEQAASDESRTDQRILSNSLYSDMSSESD